MENVGRILAFAMGINFMLLAYQVDNVTGVFGWIFGTILTLAVLASFVKPKRYPGGHGTNV
jgi:preprotein translocase subunit SecD